MRHNSGTVCIIPKWEQRSGDLLPTKAPYFAFKRVSEGLLPFGGIPGPLESFACILGHLCAFCGHFSRWIDGVCRDSATSSPVLRRFLAT